MKPLAVDLFCGLGGWTEGLLAEGWRVVGFDVEQHVYGQHRYPAQLVLQDVLTIHGSQFKDARLIVASSPCQAYSYMAMPWTRAKQIARALRGEDEFPDKYEGYRTIDELNALFEAPRRIQREACEAAGRFIPMIQENVRGAIPWVGRSAWNFGSYHLWGDVPALMPFTHKAVKVATMGAGWYPPDHPKHVPGLGFNTHADRQTRELGDGIKAGDRNKGRVAGLHAWTSDFEEAGTKNTGSSWFNVAHNTTSGHGKNPVTGPRGGKVRHDPRYPHLDPNAAEYEGVKHDGSGWRENGTLKSCNRMVPDALSLTEQEEARNDAGCKSFTPSGEPLGKNEAARKHGSKSSARKAASARIAKIPFPLAQYLAQVYYPRDGEAVA